MKMVLGDLLTRAETCIRDSGSKESPTAMVNVSTPMGQCTTDSGRITSLMEKDMNGTKMAQATLAISRKG